MTEKIKRFLEEFAEINPDSVFPTDFEDAIIGYAERFAGPPVLLLDKEKCLGILIQRDGMTRFEAEEFYDINIKGAWLGEGTPAFAVLM